MRTVNIHAAKTHLSRLIENVSGGEEIVIARAGQPVAKLVPIQPAADEDRALGGLAGKITLPPDLRRCPADGLHAPFRRSDVRVLLERTF